MEPPTPLVRKSVLFLGIDPGLRHTGLALLEYSPSRIIGGNPEVLVKGHRTANRPRKESQEGALDAQVDAVLRAVYDWDPFEVWIEGYVLRGPARAAGKMLELVGGIMQAIRHSPGTQRVSSVTVVSAGTWQKWAQSVAGESTTAAAVMRLVATPSSCGEHVLDAIGVAVFGLAQSQRTKWPAAKLKVAGRRK